MNHAPRQRHTLTVLVIGALLVCYSSALAGIAKAWSTNYLYSYGFAVPFISAYLLWARSDALRRAARQPDYVVGFLVTCVGVVMLLVGHIGAVESIEFLSFLIAMCGVTLLLFGRAVFQIAWFPIVYFVLAVPIWDRVINQLQTPSQQLSANIAVRVLHLVAIPAIQDHTLVALPNVTLDVLRECSGINQLVSVGVMALAASYLWLTTPSRRIVLVTVSVAIAYLTNGIRIALVGFLSYHNWSNGRIGVLHLAEGLAVSLVGYAVIFGCLSLLMRTESSSQRTATSANENADVTSPVPRVDRRVPAVDFAIIALLAVVAVVRTTFHAPAVNLNIDLHAIPLHIADWAADSNDVSASGFRLPGADNELVRTYRRGSGSTVRLYVGYQRYQTEGKELVERRQVAASRSLSGVRLPVTAETVEFSQSVRPTSQTRGGMLFWYDVNGRILTNLYLAKGYTIWDAVTRARTNAAVVAIEWESPGDDFIRSREDAVQFADAVVPLLRGYLPTLHAERVATTVEGARTTP